MQIETELFLSTHTVSQSVLFFCFFYFIKILKEHFINKKEQEIDFVFVYLIQKKTNK